jgi:hypothetical protein
LEWNARRVLTVWGDQTQIRDYSRRQWSGMLTGFYLPRWEKFFTAANAALASGGNFDAATFDRELQDWERRWADRHETYPTRSRGDSLKVSQRLWEKYHPALARLFAPEGPNLATGKSATCSSALPGHNAGLANDGKQSSTDSYWATDVNDDKDPWWQVDLERPVRVGRVVVVGYYGFTVEASKDGEHWEMVADRRDNHDQSTRAGYTCQFTPRELRYLRVRQTHNSANTGRHLVEVMAFAE